MVDIDEGISDGVSEPLSEAVVEMEVSNGCCEELCETVECCSEDLLRVRIHECRCGEWIRAQVVLDGIRDRIQAEQLIVHVDGWARRSKCSWSGSRHGSISVGSAIASVSARCIPFVECVLRVFQAFKEVSSEVLPVGNRVNKSRILHHARLIAEIVQRVWEQLHEIRFAESIRNARRKTQENLLVVHFDLNEEHVHRFTLLFI